MKTVMIAAAGCLIGSAAWAHAFLDHASPAVGSAVSGSPPAISLTYTEPMEPLFSTVEVTNAGGTRVDQGKPAVQDHGRVLRVELKHLVPGAYTVTWHVTSVDTHKTQGHFSFTVQP